jgi:DNA adenine methylase
MNAPIIPWVGGKRRLARQLLPKFPEHECYCEPFCGGAALFFLKEPSPVEVLNDINGDLVNLYRVVQHHLDEFVRQFRWSLASRQLFQWLAMTRPETLTDVQRAARFYYLQRQAFGGKVAGQTFGTSTTSGPRINLLRIEEDLSQAHLRLARVTIENLSWADCVARYDRPHTLFYCDPPYWGTEGYGVAFELEQYDRLAGLARTTKGRMLISVNGIPEMRRAFKGLPMGRVDIRYQVGGAGRSGKASGELVVRNWR